MKNITYELLGFNLEKVTELPAFPRRGRDLGFLPKNSVAALGAFKQIKSYHTY